MDNVGYNQAVQGRGVVNLGGACTPTKERSVEEMANRVYDGTEAIKNEIGIIIDRLSHGSGPQSPSKDRPAISLSACLHGSIVSLEEINKLIMVLNQKLFQ